MYIYVLYLEDGKYYVGKSKNPVKRIEDHVNDTGAYWTKLHKPLEVIRLIENASDFDEDKYVKEYMRDYGITNVRGGSYVTAELSQEQIKFLTAEIRGATNCCSACGSPTHFVAACTMNKSDNNNDPKLSNIKCYKCGIYGHYANMCTTGSKKTYIECKYKCGKRFKTQLNYDKHVFTCEAKPKSRDKKFYSKSKYNMLCTRCGRTNHTVDTCYVSKHIDGTILSSPKTIFPSDTILNNNICLLSPNEDYIGENYKNTVNTYSNNVIPGKNNVANDNINNIIDSHNNISDNNNNNVYNNNVANNNNVAPIVNNSTKGDTINNNTGTSWFGKIINRFRF
jgi:predicted GIY-YIG superfamily endonuclease